MDYHALGKTGLSVSRLCFGGLTIGPLQSNRPLAEGAGVIRAALDAGVNFIDTAELYGTYPYIREAIANTKNDVIIASKSYAYTYEDMRLSVESACREIDRDYIDLFLLHEQSSRMTLKGHAEALSYLCDAKQQGLIRAAGVSTHTIDVVRAAALTEGIDVIHPIINCKGIGITDGTAEEMLAAIRFAAIDCGKGIYAMKALGGGHLNTMAEEAFAWVLAQEGITSVAVGMQTLDEVRLNTTLFSGQKPDRHLLDKVSKAPRKLLVEEWCVGCGQCAKHCPMQAITITNGKANADTTHCVLCGYCGAYCPEFCLKII
ncbi:Ion-translocating oxidoreductase complex subunit B [Sporomusa silvacetica DSM 10669]|uniref:Ion-translocating oxidoreductase complex subunit B n=1 Tax=Sporomusa silvacetica DSM 10669 TaxID=1123289 RepID=A0ABZ3ILQ1_9FIRM|nr:aldo/keto reductase [Sporomusa silvacetica]OZC21915.1 general stress protein 69 [Sporomusa silvacetica DSM 10669]